MLISNQPGVLVTTKRVAFSPPSLPIPHEQAFLGKWFCILSSGQLQRADSSKSSLLAALAVPVVLEAMVWTPHSKFAISR